VVSLADALKLVLVALLWGGQFIVARYTAQSVSPFAASFLRFVVATALLLAIHLIRDRHRFRFTARQWAWLALLGITGVFLYNFFMFSGLTFAPAARASVIVAMNPALVAVFSALLFRERLSALRLLGAALALFGVAWAISGGRPGNLWRGAVGWGDLYLLGAVVCWATYSLAGKPVMRELSPRVATTYACLIGTVALAVPAALEGGLAGVRFFSLPIWLSFLYLGVLGTVVAFILFYDGIRRVGPARATVFLNLVPVFAMVLSVPILGERLSSALLVGAAMVIGGVFLTGRQAPGGPRGSGGRKAPSERPRRAAPR
jgi:drug/metabolite transporter (DMT)-like permease